MKINFNPFPMAQDSKAVARGNLSMTHWLAGLVLVAVLGWTGWLYYQSQSLTDQVGSLQLEISETQSELDQLKEQSLDAVIVAQQTIDEIGASSIVWSEVLTHLQQITPVDIFYRSYSASADGRMTVSVIADSYDSAAALLSIFESDERFSEAFAASLTQGSTESGAGVVSFGLTFNAQ